MTAEAGYSGTPLLKKLGVKAGQRALLVAAPEEIVALAEFEGWTSVRRVKTPAASGRGPFDYAHWFCADRAVFEAALPGVRATLADDGMLWISWPKKASGRASTLYEADIRAAALANRLVDVKVCAVSEVWSGLKLVVPLKERKP